MKKWLDEVSFRVKRIYSHVIIPYIAKYLKWTDPSIVYGGAY